MVWPAPSTAPAPGEEVALVSPVEQGERGTDWATVAGIVLVSEAVLLWLAACAGLARRRLALERAAREDGEE
ncbi:hypothetical protein [Actinomadura sp. 21ATH]|uniref:hypothetical protein n=1 Tax=Actinomadura sp. 21ATH TaxID=1735444 RepID=UPI0035C1DB1B